MIKCGVSEESEAFGTSRNEESEAFDNAEGI